MAATIASPVALSSASVSPSVGSAGGFSANSVPPSGSTARSASASCTSTTTAVAPSASHVRAFSWLRVTTVTGSPRSSSERATAEPI